MDSDTIKVCVVAFITTFGSVAAAYLGYLARRDDHNHNVATRTTHQPDQDDEGNS